ncbi:MAG: hypothetical protein KJ718_04040 [Nanoarchaeota archaeon]|nr:hypothetical protein [Nanoarchaeota archaeon]MBU1051699.1 hypothetical protein [Nanoarchaeota archaeon]MBU1987903.1 hypothetical protein [Nanoarchaeota archaeon]
MKLKTKPSAKIKRRYLLLEANSKKEIENTILDYIGILGWARAAPHFVKKENKIILAIERKSLNEIRAAFELSPNKIKVIKVSGTLKGLKK